MRRYRFAALFALLAIIVFAAPAFAALPIPPVCKGGTGCAASSCPAGITSAQATLPLNACPFEGESQSAVDVFSWNEFIALNWPATTSCAADTTKSILDITSTNQGPVVWQTQMSSDDVFVAAGKTPADWCKGDALQALFAKQPHAMAGVAKAEPHNVDTLMLGISQPDSVKAVGGVVTDQSGRWLRYERLMDQIEYGAIVSNKWYQLSVLNSIASLTLPTGSLEMKSAWKILTPAEIASGRYYTTTATVYNTPERAPSPGANPVTLGLVGLHIIQKTPDQQGFFWSTFEQVDNDKVFFNPHGSTTVNKQTAAKPFTELMQTGAPINAPVQIKRVTKAAANAALNAYYQKLLAGSVFANYRLISTQWQTGGAPQSTPPNLANIVIETYVQKVSSAKKAGEPKAGRPAAPSTGCLGCHVNATAANNKTLTDHSFLFLEAQ